jgi:hypothetical protein
MNLLRCTFFLHNLQAKKRGKIILVDVLLYQFNECEGIRSLNNLFNFKESEKRLNVDSVGDVLLDQFNLCERTSSLDDIFNFRESKKSLTMDLVGVPFS